MLTLRPLSADECARLREAEWLQPRSRETIGALRILNGGNPRLISIVARFGADLPFRDLMADLLALVDEHTEHFKNQPDSVAHQERRVYLALADLRKPATTREIANRARLDTNRCSVQLSRLVERGAVEVSGGTAWRKVYYPAERLYNIYRLPRRSFGTVPRVEALIHFMEAYYSLSEHGEFALWNTSGAPGEAGGIEGPFRTTIESLPTLPPLSTYREELHSVAWEGS